MLRRAIALGCALYLVGAAAAAAQSPRVLVFHPDPAGNPEIGAGVTAIKDLARPGGFQVTTTQRATDFTGANLARYRAVVFLDRRRLPGHRPHGRGRARERAVRRPDRRATGPGEPDRRLDADARGR